MTSLVTKPLFAASVMDEFRDAFRKKNASEGIRQLILREEGSLAEDMIVNAETMVMVLAMRDMETDIAGNGQKLWICLSHSMKWDTMMPSLWT